MPSSPRPIAVPVAFAVLPCLAALALSAFLGLSPSPAVAGGGEPGDEKPAETTTLEDVEGTVVEVGSFGFGLVPDDDPGTRYAPTEPLPEEFRVDGLPVVFSGEPGDPSEIRGRRWGTPIRVTEIARRPSDR